MRDDRLVLILEHNAVDASCLARAFQQQPVCHPARILRNNEQLRCYLDGSGSYTNRELFPLPSLLLVDLNYPVLGINILQWLKDAGFLSQFPVMGTGTSLPPIFVQKCFDVGLNGFFEKPSDLAKLARLICGLQWVDDLKPRLPSHPEIAFVTPEHFGNRRGDSPRQGGKPNDNFTTEYSG